MKRLLTPLVLLILILAACGDTSSEVGTGSSAEDPVLGVVDEETSDSDVGTDQPIPVEPDGGIGDGAEPLPDLIAGDPLNEQVVTDSDPVDPKVVSPTEVVANPENPSELWVRFVGGDANCTAALVTVLSETPDAISLELIVGITSDALVKSCLAGEFNLRVDVPLNESASGKQISWVQGAADDGPVAVTPNLTTDDFIGLTEEEAEAIAEENIITWRTVRVDGESFMVTQDYNPGRLNFEIDGGTISAVTLG